MPSLTNQSQLWEHKPHFNSQKAQALFTFQIYSSLVALDMLLILDVCTIYYIGFLSNYNEDIISYFMQNQRKYPIPWNKCTSDYII